jgi:hypothetical protein
MNGRRFVYGKHEEEDTGQVMGLSRTKAGIQIKGQQSAVYFYK